MVLERPENLRPPQPESYGGREQRLTPAQLDVSVDRLELHPRAPRLADVGAEMLGIESAAQGHLEVRVQGAVDRREIDVAPKVAGELDDDVSIHRGEVHSVVRFHVTH